MKKHPTATETATEKKLRYRQSLIWASHIDIMIGERLAGYISVNLTAPGLTAAALAARICDMLNKEAENA